MNAIVKSPAAVELRDEFTMEVRHGMDDARAFYANGRRSMIASIPLEQFVKWSGDDERGLVSDPDGY